MHLKVAEFIRILCFPMLVRHTLMNPLFNNKKYRNYGRHACVPMITPSYAYDSDSNGSLKFDSTAVATSLAMATGVTIDPRKVLWAGPIPANKTPETMTKEEVFTWALNRYHLEIGSRSMAVDVIFNSDFDVDIYYFLNKVLEPLESMTGRVEFSYIKLKGDFWSHFCRLSASVTDFNRAIEGIYCNGNETYSRPPFGANFIEHKFEKMFRLVFVNDTDCPVPFPVIIPKPGIDCRNDVSNDMLWYYVNVFKTTMFEIIAHWITEDLGLDGSKSILTRIYEAFLPIFEREDLNIDQRADALNAQIDQNKEEIKRLTKTLPTKDQLELVKKDTKELEKQLDGLSSWQNRCMGTMKKRCSRTAFRGSRLEASVGPFSARFGDILPMVSATEIPDGVMREARAAYEFLHEHEKARYGNGYAGEDMEDVPNLPNRKCFLRGGNILMYSSKFKSVAAELNFRAKIWDRENFTWSNRLSWASLALHNVSSSKVIHGCACIGRWNREGAASLAANIAHTMVFSTLQLCSAAITTGFLSLSSESEETMDFLNTATYFPYFIGTYAMLSSVNSQLSRMTRLYGLSYPVLEVSGGIFACGYKLHRNIMHYLGLSLKSDETKLFLEIPLNIIGHTPGLLMYTGSSFVAMLNFVMQHKRDTSLYGMIILSMIRMAMGYSANADTLANVDSLLSSLGIAYTIAKEVMLRTSLFDTVIIPQIPTYIVNSVATALAANKMEISGAALWRNSTIALLLVMHETRNDTVLSPKLTNALGAYIGSNGMCSYVRDSYNGQYMGDIPNLQETPLFMPYNASNPELTKRAFVELERYTFKTRTMACNYLHMLEPCEEKVALLCSKKHYPDTNINLFIGIPFTETKEQVTSFTYNPVLNLGSRPGEPIVVTDEDLERSNYRPEKLAQEEIKRKIELEEQAQALLVPISKQDALSSGAMLGLTDILEDVNYVSEGVVGSAIVPLPKKVYSIKYSYTGTTKFLEDALRYSIHWFFWAEVVQFFTRGIVAPRMIVLNVLDRVYHRGHHAIWGQNYGRNNAHRKDFMGLFS